MTTNQSFCRVEKETIEFLHFPGEDVLFSKEDQLVREGTLKNALLLGNVERAKVQITFQDIEGTKLVETTIWGVTDKEIILKQGRVIPICRVLNISLI